MLPAALEIPVIEFLYHSLGHLGRGTCLAEVTITSKVSSLGEKVGKLTSRCEIWQKIKELSCYCITEIRSFFFFLPNKPDELCAVNLFGPLPVGCLKRN